MPGHKTNTLRQIPIGQGNPCITGSAECSRNSRHNNALHALFHQRSDLLAATTKDERITTFQSHNVFASLRCSQHSFVNIVLASTGKRTLLANIDLFGITSCIIKDGPVDQIVIQNHIGALQQLQRLERDQFRIAWSDSEDRKDNGCFLADHEVLAEAIVWAAICDV